MATSKHKKRILKELAQNAAWRLDAGAAWLCPYCGEGAFRDARPDEGQDEAAAARAIEHLERCGAWREFEGKPLAMAELESRAHALRARDQLRKNLIALPSWQLYDVARRWYCPFCAKPTAASVPEGGRISSAALREIERHFAACEGYERGRGAEKPLQYLKSMVAYANRTRKMAEQIRRKIESDAAWRLRDAEGRWVCPYCRKVQEHIDFSAPVQMVSTAPLEIAKHLIAGCERFRAVQSGGALAQSSVSLEIARLGTAPTTDIVRLSGEPPAAVSGEFATVGAAAAAAGPGPATPRAARRDAIEEKLSAVRSLAEPSSQSGRQRAVDSAPPLPDIEGLELRSFFRGAHAHPFDFADATLLDGRRVAIAVGGVAGEGAETGLVLPMVRNLFRMHAKKMRPPREVLRLVNADLFGDLDARTYVSVIYGTLDLEGLVYRFARAGTNAPILYNAARKPDLESLDCPGMVLGIDRGPTFDKSIEEREIRLKPKDLLVQLTHGATAAEDVDGKEIGLERFKDFVRRYGRHEADYLCTKFASFFEDWTRGAPLAEDVCVLALKVKP
jgi:hypothetical protein